MKKFLRFLVTTVLAYLSSYSIHYIVKMRANTDFMSYSFIAIMIFIFLSLLINYSLKSYTKKSLAISFFSGIMFSLIEIVGMNIADNYTLPTVDISLTFAFLGIVFIVTSALNIVLIRWEEIKKFFNKMNCEKIVKSRWYSNNKVHMLVAFLLILLLWIPCFIASFPGCFAYDSPHQYSQLENNAYGNNQPFISSVILYWVITIGKTLFGSNEGGLAFFITVQMIFGAVILSSCCIFMKKLKVPVLIEFISIIFWGLVPINQMFIVNTTKDVIFSYLTLLILLIIFNILHDKEKFFKSRTTQIILTLSFVFMMFYRNTGIYVFVIFIPALCILLGKKHYKLSIVMILFPIITYKVVTGPIYEALGVRSSVISEAFSIPNQQIVNAYKVHGDKFTEEEKQWYDESVFSKRLFTDLDEEGFVNNYDPRNGDTTKTVYKDIPDNIFKLYIRLGIKYPKEYIEAFLNNTVPYWYPETFYHSFNRYRVIEYDNQTNILGITMMTKRYNLIPPLSNYYKSVAENGIYENKPVFSMLCSMGFYFVIYFFMLLISIYKKKYFMLIPMWLMVLIWGVNLIGPVALWRYVYPIALAFPLFFIALMYLNDKEEVFTSKISTKNTNDDNSESFDKEEELNLQLS